MDARELYGLPIERFTEERNALAKRLRGEGRRDEAADVSKLRKPSRAAWAVNQLARTQSRKMNALFAAGDRVQKAQADLLAGDGDRSALREAVETERAAVERLVENARGLLGSEGHELTARNLEQVSETLHTGALDEDARAQLRDACLDHELRHIGLGAIAATTAAPRTTARPGRASSPTPTGGKPRREPATQARTADVKAARQLETQARRRMDRAANGVEAAEQRRDRAAASLRDAEKAVHDADSALTSARELAATAALEYRRAQAALKQL